MTEFPIFECNVTGERFGTKNDVIEFDVRRHGNNAFDIRSRTVHIAIDALDELPNASVPFGLGYVGVEDGRVLGAVIESEGICPWYDRDDAAVSHHEPFFEFVEAEVLYP